MAYSLSGERPFVAAWPFALLVSLRNLIAQSAKARRRRIGLASLLEMDDHRLWDLGISRYDLTRALRSDDFDIDAVRDRRSAEVWPPR